uniref:Uncharacterized protein n=1 Tax=Meloidogyne enterolobii TaxID=390850 RepID=A0A6V7UQQ8_MELEN|nr:unnamed protein product [Meloidogyne enterolobii]
MSKSFNLLLILTFIQILPSISSGGGESLTKEYGYKDGDIFSKLVKKYSSESFEEYTKYLICLIRSYRTPQEYLNIIKQVYLF